MPLPAGGSLGNHQFRRCLKMDVGSLLGIDYKPCNFILLHPILLNIKVCKALQHHAFLNAYLYMKKTL